MEVIIDTGEYQCRKIGGLGLNQFFELEGYAYAMTAGASMDTSKCVRLSDLSVHEISDSTEVRLLELVAPIKLRRVRK